MLRSFGINQSAGGGGGGGTPGGSSGQVQYNNGGAFGGGSQLIWDETNKRLGIGALTPTNDLSFGGNVARIVWMERTTTAATAGFDFTMQAGGAVSGGGNLNGGNLVLSGGTATGTGSSQIKFFTAGGGTTGDKAPTEKWKIDGTGNFLATTDATYDIGASGATRPANIWAATTLRCGANAFMSNAAVGFVNGNNWVSTGNGMEYQVSGSGRIIFFSGGNVAFSTASNVYCADGAASLGLTSGTFRFANAYLTTAVFIAGNQIIGTRKTGWAAWTGVATRTTVATGSATTQNCAEAIKALIDDLTSHGIIGT